MLSLYAVPRKVGTVGHRICAAAHRRLRAQALGRHVRRIVALVLGPVLAGAGLMPVVFTAAAAAVSVAAVAASVAPAHASTGSVLILSTSVNGGISSAEAGAVPSGYTVTVATPTTWDAMTTAEFKAYSAIIIGDPSTSSCATTAPSDALSTAATWEPP